MLSLAEVKVLPCKPLGKEKTEGGREKDET